MGGPTIDEFYRELNATDEAYVRRKFLLGGYSRTQMKHVRAWLSECDAQRAEQRAALDSAISSRTAFWTMIGAYAAAGATVVTILTTIMLRVA